MVLDIGRLCVKTAGRDAGQTCVVVEKVDDTRVLIDGATRRRPCNIEHLEALPKTVDIKKGASHADVEKAFKKEGLTVRSTKPKKAGAKPTQQRKVKEKVEKAPKAAPAKETKEAPKAEKNVEAKPAAKEAKK